MVKDLAKIISKLLLTVLIGISIFSYDIVYASYHFVNHKIKLEPFIIKEPIQKYTVYGKEYYSNTDVIDLSHSCIDNDLVERLSLFKKLKSVDLRNHNLSFDYINNLKEVLPNVRFKFTIELNNKKYNTDIEELDLNHIKVNYLEEFKTKLRLFDNLKKLDMSYSNLSNEILGSLREEFPKVQIDWVLHISKWSFRTDVKSFSVLVYRFDYKRIQSHELEIFKYCWNMEALDLGHQAITDVTPIAKYLPNLKILILADNKISDVSPLASLTKLHYLELFINPIKDLSPLTSLKELIDINLCYTRIKDFTPLNELPFLERIWLVGTKVNKDNVGIIQKNHPGAKIVYGRGGSTNSGFRTHERYYEMIKMYRNPYYMSPAFSKYDGIK